MSDIIPLEEIPVISIRGGQEEGPGIDIDQVFWVRHRILRRDDLRASLDEQIVLDITLDMLDIHESLSTQTRNSAYDDETQLGKDVAARLAKRGEQRLADEFDAAMQVCRQLCVEIERLRPGKSLMDFMGRPAGNPAGRYFHVFFMAVVMCHGKGKRLGSVVDLAYSVEDIWKKDSINRGGNWTFDDRRKEIVRCQKLISDAFVADGDGDNMHNDVQLLLRDLNSYELENERFELKGGLVPLDANSPKVSPSLLEKILKISTAIANVGPQGEGRIYIGVTDSPSDTKKFEERYAVEKVDCLGRDSLNFDIVGIDHEVISLGESLDLYHGRLMKSFRDSSKITDESFRKRLLDGVKLLRIVDRQGSVNHVIMIRVPAVDSLVEFDGSFWVKVGSDTVELKGRKLVLKLAEFEAAS